jgi:hypothetical protein
MSLPNIRVYIKPDAAFKASGNGVLGTSVLGSGFLLGPPSASFVELTPITAVSIRRGRTRATDSFDAGTATVSFIDTTGTFNPDNTSSILYVDGVSYIKPLRQFKITVTNEGTEYLLFTGYVNDFQYNYSPGVNAVQVTISAVDAFRVLSLGNVETIATATYNELSSERIKKILNQASIPIPTGVQSIKAGDTYVDDDPGTVRSTLEAVQQVEHTEMGAFFMDADGYYTFYGRKYLQQLASGSVKMPLIFDESIGLGYEAITQTFDDENITNDITISATTSIAEVQKTNATSILDYSNRSVILSDTLLVSDAEANNLANYLLNFRKDPQLVISGIECSPLVLSDVTPTNLSGNPSLEVNGTGWGGFAGATAVRTAGTFFDGLYFLRATANNATSTGYIVVGCPSRIACTAGLTYTASVYARHVSGDPRNGGISIIWYDSGGAIVTSLNGSRALLTTATQRYSVTATAPATAVTFSLWGLLGVVGSSTTADVSDWDGCLVQEGATLNNYRNDFVSVVTAELLEPVTVTKTYSGSAVDLNRTLTLQSIDHDIRPGSWSLKLGLAEPLGGDALVLDYGRLDVNTLGY